MDIKKLTREISVTQQITETDLAQVKKRVFCRSSVTARTAKGPINRPTRKSRQRRRALGSTWLTSLL